MKPARPVVLDERFVYAFTVYYSIAGIWGILATRNGIASILATGGPFYESIFTVALAVVSITAAVLTVTDFQRAEKYFTLAWIVIVSAYPAAIIYQWIAEDDITKSAPSASTFMYLIFPFARYVYLALKTRKRNE